MNNQRAFESAFNMLCGKKIGEGMTREVFECHLLPNCIVKVEIEPKGIFQNIAEWQVWNEVQNTNFEKYFAPIEWLSQDGLLLIMQKTFQPPLSLYPKELPIFFTDFKRSNYGMIGDNFVCHDYGTTLMLQTGYSKRMKKVDWN